MREIDPASPVDGRRLRFERDQGASVAFNHGIGELLGAVMDAGLELMSFEEHRSVPWNLLGDAMVDHDGELELREHPERLAASHTLRARRR